MVFRIYAGHTVPIHHRSLIGPSFTLEKMTEEFTAVDAMTEIVIFDPDRIDEELENDRIETALLLTATMAEAILRDELIRHFNIPRDAFDEVCGNKTLGWYVSKCNEKGIIDETTYRNAFDTLVKKRAKLVHEYGYLVGRLDQDDDTDEGEKMRRTIKECYDWFESRRQES
jgi:hypothetical protein